MRFRGDPDVPVALVAGVDALRSHAPGVGQEVEELVQNRGLKPGEVVAQQL